MVAFSLCMCSLSFASVHMHPILLTGPFWSGGVCFHHAATARPEAAVAVEVLTRAASNAGSRVQEVCLGVNLLSQEAPPALAMRVDDFITYMLSAMEHPDSDVAIEATVFWMQYVDLNLPREKLLAVLPTLVERLLRHMVFEEHDEEVAAALAAEEGRVKDAPAELKPFVSHHEHDSGAGGDSAPVTEDGSGNGAALSL
jgi:hypothetical protein